MTFDRERFLRDCAEYGHASALLAARENIVKPTITAMRDQLDEYAEAEAICAQLAQEEERAVEAVTPPEIQKAIQDVHAEFGPKVAAAAKRIGELATEIKGGVALLGKTVEGLKLVAKFQAGRDIWDTAKLEHYAETHKYLAKLKKKTKPTVTIGPREKDSTLVAERPIPRSG